MQYTEMVGATIDDESPYGCRFMFGGVPCRTPKDSYRVTNGVLYIKQHVVKTNLRSQWRGETTDQWKTAHPVDESILADIRRAKEIIEQIPQTSENKYKIEEALRILDHGIGRAAEVYILSERSRRDKYPDKRKLWSKESR